MLRRTVEGDARGRYARQRSKRRQFACTCLDWSERRDHLGGALGAALAAHFTQQGWIERKKHSRVVQVTIEGATQFRRLGIKLPA